MEQPAGVLLGWWSSTNPKSRHKVSVILCSRCQRVWTLRMDRFLGDADSRDCSQTCGCGMEANRAAYIERVIFAIDPDDWCEIAEGLERGRTKNEIAEQFKLEGSMIPFVLARIWKRWTDSLWRRLAPWADDPHLAPRTV